MGTLTEVVRTVRLLKIDGYSSMPATTDDYFISTSWNIYGFDWEIRFYPATKWTTEMDIPWVAVELSFPSEASRRKLEATLRCQLVLVDRRGKPRPSDDDETTLTVGPKQNDLRVYLGTRRTLATSGYLKHDYLTVQCTITLLEQSPDITIIPAKEVGVPSSNLHQHLAQLQQSETGSDVTFLVVGESFAAHKNMLAARSPVFMAEFFGRMSEKSTRHVEVKDMEAAVFKAMLRFIYTDTVPELDQKLETVTMMAQHLLAAADRYGLDRLKLICEGKLSDSIDADMAATTLALAEQHNCSQLKTKCIEFIIETPTILDAVLATEGFKHLEASCPLVLRDLLRSACGRKRLKRS